MNWQILKNTHDGFQTAISMGFIKRADELRLAEIRDITPREFAKMGCSNHPARTTYNLAKYEKLFERLHKSPKFANGYTHASEDIASIKHAMSSPCEPIMLFHDPAQKPHYVLLDGAHRLCAAYLLKSPIRAYVYERI